MDNSADEPKAKKRRTLNGRIGDLWLCETGADVHFQCFHANGQEELIPAHKTVLISCSDVFVNQFYGALPESESDPIKIPDICAEVFKEFLKFAYRDQVTPHLSHAGQLLYCAKKYLVEELEDRCISYIKERLKKYEDDELLLLEGLLNLDDREREGDLLRKCMRRIEDNGERAVASQQFLSLNQSTIALILQRDTFNAQESTIFRALIKWSEKTCSAGGLAMSNRREVLANLLPHVRFPNLSFNELSALMNECQILTDKEIVDIVLAQSNKKLRECLTFSSEPRIDRFRSHGTIRLTIQNFIDFANRKIFDYSECIYVRGLPWKLGANCTCTKQSDLRVFLTADFKNRLSSCVVPKIVYRLISQKEGCHSYESSEDDNSFCYIDNSSTGLTIKSIEAILNRQNGWYLSDCVILEVYFEADKINHLPAMECDPPETDVYALLGGRAL